jgi:hypothetical protein
MGVGLMLSQVLILPQDSVGFISYEGTYPQLAPLQLWLDPHVARLAKSRFLQESSFYQPPSPSRFQGAKAALYQIPK